MATPAQLDEKRKPVAPDLEGIATPAQLAEKARQDQAWGSPSVEAFATQAQLDEKARKDREGASAFATPAQLAEKARSDQGGASAFATPAQLAEKARGRPPPLPPRESFTAPPAYSSDDAKRNDLISEQWRSHDPRSSSTHSLVPEVSHRSGRRTLLLVFIHGFMGNESSFQSFPAHVHNLLTITLSETHVVHTKIYPRYKSRKDIQFARDDFSIWLEPHEDDRTDIILLGHSMGGILAAEVALQKPISPATGKPFRHRILGTISFDTPFLGMHPGVVVSGIGSLFRPAPDPPGKLRQQSTSGTASPPMDSHASVSSQSYAPSTISSESSLSLVQSITSPLSNPSSDPYFNEPFPNDVRLPERKGWTNLLHFVTKHSDGLTRATTEYFKSHLEFGGCLADYPGLLRRYESIRALEDIDDSPRPGLGYQQPIRRIRFLNYYTASTGRPKAPKIPLGHMLDKDREIKPIETEMQDLSVTETENSNPRISAEEHSEGAITPQPLVEGAESSPFKAEMETLGQNSGVQDSVQENSPELGAMQHVDSMPMEDDEIPDHFLPQPTAESVLSPTETSGTEPLSLQETTTSSVLSPAPTEPELPPLPPIPTEPEPINFELYTDKDSRKIAQKEQKRVMKVYQTALKDRESAVKDRKRLIEKREKKTRQERDKALKAEEKQRLKDEKEAEKAKTAATSLPQVQDKGKERQASETPSTSTKAEKAEKPKRDKKFCMLPSEKNGVRDKCWVRIYMEGVDEVGAHCGLFLVGPQYESLVGSVGERIGQWVEEDALKRNRS